MNPLIQAAMAIALGPQQQQPAPASSSGPITQPLDAGTGPVAPGATAGPSPTLQSQNLPGGNTPLPQGQPLPTGGNLGNLARILGGGGGRRERRIEAPHHRFGIQEGGVPKAIAPPQSPFRNTAAPMAPAITSVGALMASPMGKQLLQRLMSLQSGALS